MSERSGSVLIIVVGIVAMLAVLAVAFFARMRADGEEVSLVARDAQARIALVAALQYLQETSRIGWGDPADPDRDGECWGWTDVRDGSLGPRGRRKDDGTLPVPAWWTGGRYPDDADGDPQNAYVLDERALPPKGTRRWPCPGSAMRGDLFVRRLPPRAVRLTRAPNPVSATPDDPDDWGVLFARTKARGVGMYDPQPVADDWTAFRAGDPEPRPSTAATTWFRCYRELPSDHDADGTPWYDRVPLTGHGAFIVACGAGSSRGFRFWDASEPGFSRDLEPLTAQESGLFPDRDFFEQARAGERILWFRAEWTAFSGGGANVNDLYRNGDQLTGTFTRTGNANNPMHGSDYGIDFSTELLPTADTVPSFFGAWKWIQRLEKDPGTW